MQGKIIKGIAGFYYVHVVGSGTYECKAKGVFRKDNTKPLVGDHVEISVLNEEEKIGNIDVILPRRNSLIRPAVANIDQAVVIFAATSPKPNLNLLDRFLLIMESQDIPTHICFNKCDLIDDKEKERLEGIYENTGYQVLFVSAKKDPESMKAFKKILVGKTSTVAGPSGVGKSTIINQLQEEVEMETGQLSEKIDRGKHTTRHSQLIKVAENSFIMDTPGFTSLSIEDFEKEELWEYFPEFREYECQCKFAGCSHISEPSCGVRDALTRGEISQSRYDNYLQMYDELKNGRVVYTKKGRKQ